MIEYIARECMRFDTVVARAFRVALGMPAALPGGRKAPRGASAAAPGPWAYEGTLECFANERHVLL